MKWTKTTLKKLEDLYGELDYRIRYEKGQFQSGHCIVESQRMVVINKFYDTEGRIQALLEILIQIDWQEKELSEPSAKFIKKLMKTFESESAVSGEENKTGTINE